MTISHPEGYALFIGRGKLKDGRSKGIKGRAKGVYMILILFFITINKSLGVS